MKDLRLSVFVISTLKLIAWPFEWNHKLPAVSEWFELYSFRLYIGTTKPKSSATSIIVSSISLIHFVNGVLFLNATCVWGAPVTVISPFTKM